MAHERPCMDDADPATLAMFLHYLAAHIGEAEDLKTHAERQGAVTMLAEYVGAIDRLRTMETELMWLFQHTKD